MPYKDKKDPRLLAYKKRYYEENKDMFSYKNTKDAIKKWAKCNPGKVKQINNRSTNNRTDLRKKEVYERQKKYDYNNMKKHSSELSDLYLRKYLLKQGFTGDLLAENPIIIEVKRLILKTKRI